MSEHGKKLHDQVREALTNELGLTREYVRGQAEDLIVEAVQKYLRSTSMEKVIKQVIREEMVQQFPERGVREGFRGLLYNAASDVAKEMIKERLVLK